MENYEDALFALLMDEVAQEEGRKLLEENQRLRQDPAAAVPADLDQRCMRTIKQAFAKSGRRRAGQTAYRVFQKAAVAAVIAILLMTTAFAAFPEVRIKTINFLIEMSDKAASITMSNLAGVDGGSLMNRFRLPELPEGFALTDEGNDIVTAWAVYSNDAGATIRFEIINAVGTRYNVDTENAEVENITIHGFEGMLIEKNESITVVWGDTVQNCFVSVDCKGLDKADVWRMAQELEISAAVK